MTEIIRDVTDTAFMVAMYRALESARPDALFHDPLAERLAGEEGRRILAVERVRLDLTDVEARRALLDRIGGAGRKVLVLTEGVIPYLDEPDVAALADDLAVRPSFAAWIVDYISPHGMRLRQGSAHARRMRNVPFLFEPDDWFAFFRAHGWEVGEMRYFAVETRRLGRRIPLSGLARLLLPLRLLFLSREKREAFAKMAGFALLEPKRQNDSDR
jgi:O-methyltransferase involved in polyketide biosynthesis